MSVFVCVQEEAARWERRAMRMEEQVEELMGRDHELRCKPCAVDLHLNPDHHFGLVPTSFSDGITEMNQSSAGCPTQPRGKGRGTRAGAGPGAEFPPGILRIESQGKGKGAPGQAGCCRGSERKGASRDEEGANRV